MSDRLERALRAHFLWDLLCDEEAKTDTAVCACTLHLGPYPSVGEAVEAWIRHVREELAPLDALLRAARRTADLASASYRHSTQRMRGEFIDAFPGMLEPTSAKMIHDDLGFTLEEYDRVAAPPADSKTADPPSRKDKP